MRVSALYSNQLGVTLLEVLLVIAIAASLLLIGAQTYQQLNLQSQLTKANFNVNVLFQAMRNYYYANCIANRNYATGNQINTATGAAATGLLDPSSSSYTAPSGSSLGLNITTNLVTPGFLTSWNSALSTIATNYVVQFNLYNNATTYTGNVRSVQFCYSVTPGTSATCNPVPTVATNNIYLWTIQVAIKVDSAKASQYRNLLGADCVSSLAGGIVSPCSGAHTAVDYVVFERLPSYASSAANSPLWLSDPMLKLFKRQYTNDEDYAVTTSDATYFPGYQNYLCGG